MVNMGGSAFGYTTRKCLGPAVASLLGASILSVHAEQIRGFDTPRCKEAVTRIVAEAGASFDHLAPSGDNVFLSHPAAREFVLMCGSYQPLSLSISWRDAFPTAAYYELLGRAGAVITSADVSALARAARTCQLAALKATDEEAEHEIPGVALNCTAFTRDGGGTLIDIRPPSTDPRS